MSSTGQIIGGVVGAVVGFFVGNPIMGAQIGMTLGGLVDPPKTLGPRLNDLSAQTSSYGAFIPRIYGTAPVVGNIFWIQGNKLIEHKADGGGKGGPTVTNFEYFATFAVGLCEGPIAGVRRIWIGGQLWYDAGSSDLSTIIASNENAAGFTLYPGSDTQLADPLIQADHGVADVPAYRGLAYIVFNELALKSYSNSLAGAQVKVEVVMSGATQIPTLVGTFAPTEYVNYSANGITQTAVVSTLAGVSGINVYSTCTFTDYDSSTGSLLKQFTVTATLTATGYIGSLFSSSVGGGFVIGKYGVAFVGTHVSGHRHVAFSDEPIGDGILVSNSVSFPSSSGASEYCFFAGGHYWFGYYGTTQVTRVTDNPLTLDNRAIEFSIPHSANAMAFVDDSATGSTYIRYTTASPYKSRLVDITGDLNPENPLFDIQLPGSGYINQGSGFAAFDGKIIHATSPLHVYDIALGADIQDHIIEPLFSGHVRPVSPGVFIFNGNIYALNHTTSGTVALSTIVQSECLKSDLLTAADLDMTDLTDQVRGYRVSSLAPLRGGIDPLRKAWPFDAIQHGYKIKFKRRGGASVATITEGELDARAAGAQPGVQITNTREMDLVLPKQLTAQYLDATREYDVNVAEESRQ